MAIAQIEFAGGVDGGEAIHAFDCGGQLSRFALVKSHDAETNRKMK